jgi:S-adenosylmethionine-diacylglycerol 3-amino-3-carboxypropyl transferase
VASVAGTSAPEVSRTELPPGPFLAARRRSPVALLASGPYRAPRQWHKFLSNRAIPYTTCDEDSWSEISALSVGADDSVLSVTGSGCRSLSLLLDGPRRLVSIDHNPLQNLLLELKAIAMRHLGHGEFLRFVGVRDSTDRVRVYDNLRGDLEPATRGFWDENRAVIAEGIIYSGAHERYYRKLLTPAIGGLWRNKIERLFAFTDLDEQRAFYNSEWNSPIWRFAIRTLCRPGVFRMTLADPGYFLHIELDQPVGDYLLDRFEHALTSRLARENHFLALLLLGRYHNEEAVPPYLQAEHYERIRAHLPALEVVTAGLAEYLERVAAGTFDKFSLSDVSGYTTPDEFQRILAGAVESARPSGRLCYRNFLTKRPIPPDLAGRMVARRDIASLLDERDLAFAFTFEVADLAGPLNVNGRPTAQAPSLPPV